MDYKNHYNILINRAHGRLLEGYCERHHIIPKCMGGTNNSENLVDLTPEEHYVAHQLLVKIYPKHEGLILAVNLMSGSGMSGRNNKSYGWIRRKVSDSKRGKKHTAEHRKKNSIANSGENNAMYGKKHTEEALRKMRKPKTEEAKRNMSLAKLGKNRGKTYEEIYGKKIAHKLKKVRSQQLKGNTHGTANKGRLAPNRKQVIIDGVQYNSAKEAAIKIGVHPVTVRRWIKAGKIKYTPME